MITFSDYDECLLPSTKTFPSTNIVFRLWPVFIVTSFLHYGESLSSSTKMFSYYNECLLPSTIMFLRLMFLRWLVFLCQHDFQIIACLSSHGFHIITSVKCHMVFRWWRVFIVICFSDYGECLLSHRFQIMTSVYCHMFFQIMMSFLSHGFQIMTSVYYHLPTTVSGMSTALTLPAVTTAAVPLTTDSPLTAKPAQVRTRSWYMLMSSKPAVQVRARSW